MPLLNEARGLPQLERRLTAVLDRLGRPWTVLVVDDGSTDATLAELKALNARDPRYRAISFSRNFGKEVAVAAGLREARGDAVVIIDGDLQHPPETIAEFVRAWDAGYDIVYGVRRDRETDGPVRRLLSGGFYRLFRTLSGTELPRGAGDFRLLDRRAVDAMNRMGERARFNKGLYAWIGFKATGVPFDVEARHDGGSRWRLRKLLAFAIDGFATFTTIPLRVWSYVGLLISGFAFLYALVFLAKTLLLRGRPARLPHPDHLHHDPRRRAAHLARRHRRISGARLRGGERPPPLHRCRARGHRAAVVGRSPDAPKT